MNYLQWHKVDLSHKFYNMDVYQTYWIKQILKEYCYAHVGSGIDGNGGWWYDNHARHWWFKDPAEATMFAIKFL